MNRQYLLRIEAVNFGPYLEDTQDLSTIRGAGLLMLHAPEALETVAGLKRVYAGASSALYELTTDNPAKIKDLIEKELHQDERAEATILVTIAEKGETLRETLTRLVNQTRWEQLQSPSAVYPELIGTDIDQLDDIRPAVARKERQPPKAGSETGDPWLLSESTRHRRLYGLKQKQGFYEKTTGLNLPNGFVPDFNALAENKTKANLTGKMAVLYLDGNSFGAIARACRTSKELGSFSATVRANQDAFLKHLLRVNDGPHTDGMSSWRWTGTTYSNEGKEHPKKNAFRIETLLWGGDEVILVVPAWCGWQVLAEFFRTYGHLRSPDGRTTSDRFNADREYSLTHGAAVVFCHAKAPIHRIVRLAKTLADRPKELGTPKPTDLDGVFDNVMTYQVLESFDHLGNDANATRDARVPPILRGSDALMLHANDMHEIERLLCAFRKSFPRSKLHDIAEMYGGGNEREAFQLGVKEVDRAGLGREFQDLRAKLGRFTEGDDRQAAATWVHILDLWDYTPAADWSWPADGESE